MFNPFQIIHLSRSVNQPFLAMIFVDKQHDWFITYFGTPVENKYIIYWFFLNIL